jgi:hypothetical protein
MRLSQIVYSFFGWFFLVIGLLGVVLPGLPHTPFSLLSVWCFSKGSPRIHSWMLGNKYIGPSVRDWQQHKRISKKAKILAVIWIGLSISLSAYLVQKIELKAMLVAIGILVSVFILSRKS